MKGLKPQMEGELKVSLAALILLRVSGVASSRFLIGWMDMEARDCRKSERGRNVVRGAASKVFIIHLSQKKNCNTNCNFEEK